MQRKAKANNGNKRRKKSKSRKIQARKLKQNSLERSTLLKSVGINRKLNIARKELEFLPTYDPKLGSGCRLKGSDYVGTLVSGAGSTGTAPGSVLLDILVAPGEFDNTRIQQFSALFERYRVRSWTFWYIPAVPSTTPGNLLAYPDYDVADSLSTAVPLNEALAHMGSQLFNVYSETPVQFDRVDPYTDLFTDADGADPRLTYVGRLRYLAAANLGNNTTYGSIYMEYDIDFYIPQLQSGILATSFAGNLYLKVVTTGTAPAIGQKVQGGTLETSPSTPSLTQVGAGNIFSAIFQADPASATTSLYGSPFSGASMANVQQQIFFKTVPNVGNSSNNSSYCQIYRSLADAESDTPSIYSTTSTYANTFQSSSDWLASAAGMAGGLIAGTLSSIRLIPFSRYDAVVY